MPIIAKQLQGEHVQLFALRVDKLLQEATNNTAVDDCLLLQILLDGLWPSCKIHLIHEPTSLDALFQFWETIPFLLPATDSFWRRHVNYSSNTLMISIRNEYALYEPQNPKDCYRCGILGHFAWQCTNARTKKL